MQIADANIVLRYVLNDHTELSMRAAEILEYHDVVVPVEVICEVVYVLQKVIVQDIFLTIKSWILLYIIQ